MALYDASNAAVQFGGTSNINITGNIYAPTAAVTFQGNPTLNLGSGNNCGEIIAASIKDHPEWGLQLSADYKPRQLKNPAGYSRYAVRQGDVQLRTGLDAALQWMEDQGEMNKILSKWGLGGYNN